MENKKVFRVAVLGNLSAREWQILASATRLTTARARSYLFERPSETPADIYLVQGDQAEALNRWHALRARHAAPAVFLVADPQRSAGRREFRCPLVPSCLLGLVNLLDEVTVQELHYLPELNIGHEAAPTVGAVAVGNKRARFSALVVDDSTTVQAQVGLGLKMYGVGADFADSAERALSLLDANQYDIAFLDVVLPGGADGYQICKAIKKNPRSRHTVVIMLTSKSSTFDRVKASLAGCDAFLTKPVQNDIFQQILRKYLDDTVDLRAGSPAAAK